MLGEKAGFFCTSYPFPQMAACCQSGFLLGGLHINYKHTSWWFAGMLLTVGYSEKCIIPFYQQPTYPRTHPICQQLLFRRGKNKSDFLKLLFLFAWRKFIFTTGEQARILSYKSDTMAELTDAQEEQFCSFPFLAKFKIIFTGKELLGGEKESSVIVKLLIAVHD